MKNFNRGGGFGDKRSGGGGFGRRDSGGRDSGGRSSGGRGFDRGGERPEMHKAICADCGSPCEVPFKPNGEKPVYCSNCFKGKDDSNSQRSERRDFSRPSFGGDKQMFQAVCDECGNTCEVPFKPSNGKPVFCSNCFGKSDKGGAKTERHNDFGGHAHGTPTSDQFDILNAKLDKIMKSLNISAPAAAVVKKEIAKETAFKDLTIKAVAPKEEKKAASKSIVKKLVKKPIVSKVSAKVVPAKKAKKK